MKKVKFTKGFVDTVIRMYADREDAKQWLRERLFDNEHNLTEEHFNEMIDYTNAQ